MLCVLDPLKPVTLDKLMEAAAEMSDINATVYEVMLLSTKHDRIYLLKVAHTSDTDAITELVRGYTRGYNHTA